MKKTSLLVLALLIASLFLGPRLGATSLWNGGAPSLFEDFKAQGVGDLLTVLIMEHSKASAEADTDTEQSFGFKLDSGTFLTDFFPGLSPSLGDSAGAHGTTSRSGAIIAQITVAIAEVLPNGNFFLEGEKAITVNGETETIVIKGIVRPHDITRNNTVNSTQMADVAISYKGKGVVGNKQRPSPLEWLLNWLF